MLPYTLDKLYCDTDLLDEGHVFVYLTRVRLGPTLDCRWHVVLSRRGGEPRQETRVTRSLGRPERTRFTTTDGQFHCRGQDALLRLDGGHVAVHLQYHGQLPFEPANELAVTGSGGRTVTWTPVMLRAGVSGFVTVGGRTVSLDRSVGYVDHVRSTLYPWRVPIRRLFWGRSHQDQVALTYTIAQHANGTTTALLVADCAGRALRFTDVELEPLGWQSARAEDEPNLTSYLIRARGNGHQLTVAIENEAVAVASDFIVDAGPLHPLSRWALERISLRPRGTKHFARASVALHSAGEPRIRSTGSAFVEQVRLG